MRSKFLLATTSLVALGLMAAPASAKPAIMGKVEIDLSYYWDDYGSSEDEYTMILASGRVNVPYDEFFNLQFDVTGAASTEEGDDNGSAGSFGIGAHMNWRDPKVGLLGIFAALGRANALYGDGPLFMAGFEGQYYCDRWTMFGQLGWMDTGQDTNLLHDAGFVRGGVNYYASDRLKLVGALKYIDGDVGYGSSSELDSYGWDWDVRVVYMFGKSMPVSTFLEVGGRYAETNYGYSSSYDDLDVVWANIGVTFYLGGEGTSDLMYQDRYGASVDLPDYDEVRVPYAAN